MSIPVRGTDHSETETTTQSSSPERVEIGFEPAAEEVVSVTLEATVAKDLLLALTRALGRAAYND